MVKRQLTRRAYLNSLTAFGLASTIPLFYNQCSNQKPKNILVLGGTNFVGPAIVNALLAEGYSVTLFNRGITNPTLFPELDLIKGDREEGTAAYQPLQGIAWDVIIDVWPEKATLVEEATEALQAVCDHYVFISSIAVYNDFNEVGLHEDSEVVDISGDRSSWYYSEEKLAAERAVQERFPDNHTILRPGPIKGWRDPAMDLLYWCVKLNRDEAIIAPGSGEDPIQFIDVKDVGGFCSYAIEQGLGGIFNCTGPRDEPLLWKEFLDRIKSHYNSKTELVWAPEEFLRDQSVYSFSDLPLWAPLSEDRGFMQISNRKLVDTGFQYCTIEQTLEDCMDWHGEAVKDGITFGDPEVGGLSRKRELELLTLLAFDGDPK